MIVLLVIVGAWLGLLLIGLGMLHVATSTPTPRPVASTLPASVADTHISAAEPEGVHQATHAVAA